MRLFVSLTAAMLCFAPTVTLANEGSPDDTYCEALESAVTALADYAMSSGIAVNPRADKVFIDAYPTKPVKHRRPKAISRAEWKSYEFIRRDSLALACSNLTASARHIKFMSSDEFEAIGSKKSVTRIQLREMRLQPDSNRIYLDIFYHNDNEDDPSIEDGGFVGTRMLLEKADDAYRDRIVAVETWFYSGVNKKFVVSYRCMNADDLSDCKVDTTRVR